MKKINKLIKFILKMINNNKKLEKFKNKINYIKKFKVKILNYKNKTIHWFYKFNLFSKNTNNYLYKLKI